MLEEHQVKKAVQALYAYQKKQKAQKTNDKSKKASLIEDDGDNLENRLQLIVGLKRISDKVSHKPMRIPIPHNILPENPEVCVIVKDPQRYYKDLLLGKKEFPYVSKVIGVNKLRQKYKPYEAKRNLCDSYDMFFADDRVTSMLPKMLGKTFFEKKRLPAPVDLTKKDLKKELDSAFNSTYLHLNKGSCISVKIGNTEMSEQQIVENIMAAVKTIGMKIPQKWDNIQSIQLKTTNSVALPMFSSAPKVEEAAAIEEKKVKVVKASA